MENHKDEDILIKFLYQETSREEEAYIHEKLLEDDSFQQLFFSLLETKQLLDEVEREPSEEATNNILAYSRSLMPVGRKVK